jgi:hypothetical protein
LPSKLQIVWRVSHARNPSILRPGGAPSVGKTAPSS